MPKKTTKKILPKKKVEKKEKKQKQVKDLNCVVDYDPPAVNSDYDLLQTMKRKDIIEYAKKILREFPGIDKVYYGFVYDGKEEKVTYVRFR